MIQILIIQIILGQFTVMEKMTLIKKKNKAKSNINNEYF